MTGRQIWTAARCNFMGFFRNPRVWISFGVGMVLCFLLSGKVISVAEYYQAPMQAAEPFIWTFGDATAILLVSLVLIFLLSDLPRISPFTPFYLVRTSRSGWLAAQVVYLALVTVLYVAFLLLITTVLCAKYSFPGNLWSETAARLGYSQLGKTLQVPSTVKVMESITPYGCMAWAGLLILGYSLTLGLLILLGNLLPGRKYGMFLALGYSLYGFLLNPQVLGKLMGLENYEMYRIRSIVGWISPLNHAVYGMHDFGYDHLPSLVQSMAFFTVLWLGLYRICQKLLKSYNFAFLGGL